jgi:hypothetical protein
VSVCISEDSAKALAGKRIAALSAVAVILKNALRYIGYDFNFVNINSVADKNNRKITRD